MGFFTLRNTTIMALVQVGLIVAGVLAAGAAHKCYTSAGLRPPLPTAYLSEYGFLALGLPLAWVLLAVLAFRRGENDGEEIYCWLAVFSGLLFLLLLLVGIWHGAARPLLRLLGGCTLGST